MRLLLVLLAAATASAADIDINAPGFWTKAYDIPSTYCARSIKIEAPHSDRLKKLTAPCDFETRAGTAYSQCRVPPKDSERIAAALRREGRLLSYSQQCDPAPNYSELYYKRENLSRERAELSVSSESIPAISGLLAGQLETLNRLIGDHEWAMQPELNIAVVDPKATPQNDTSGSDRRTAMRRAKQAKRAVKITGDASVVSSPGAWVRYSQQPCAQIAPIIVEYAKIGEKERTALAAVAQKLGKPYSDHGCDYLNDPRLVSAVLSDRSESDIRKRLIDLPGLRSWKTEAPPRNRWLIADDQRFDLLTAELAAQKDALSRTPHIRGLVSAEIERVRESAAELRRLRTKQLLLIYVMP